MMRFDKNEPGYRDITALIEAECKSECGPAKYTSYFALMGELYHVFCEGFGENK